MIRFPGERLGGGHIIIEMAGNGILGWINSHYLKDLNLNGGYFLRWEIFIRELAS